jgi:hypothetical protein
MKMSIADNFLKRFTLFDAEKQVLNDRDVPISDAFFDALDRTSRIKDDCAFLLQDGEENRAGYYSSLSRSYFY